MRRLLTAVVFGASARRGAHAQEHAGRILDLIFKVEDLGGKVESLQVRETETETRIELPADILFDFDKADIRPAAGPALKQAAEIIRKGARGSVTVEGHTDAKGCGRLQSKTLGAPLGVRAEMAGRARGPARHPLSIQGLWRRASGRAQRQAERRRRSGRPQKNRRVEIVFSKTMTPQGATLRRAWS